MLLQLTGTNWLNSVAVIELAFGRQFSHISFAQILNFARINKSHAGPIIFLSCIAVDGFLLLGIEVTVDQML